MNLGETEVEIQFPVSSLGDPVINTISSRRGKEETKLKTSDSEITRCIKESDLRVEENPCNWTRESL